MARNPYFKDYTGEQDIVEELTIETIKTPVEDPKVAVSSCKEVVPDPNVIGYVVLLPPGIGNTVIVPLDAEVLGRAFIRILLQEDLL